MAKIHPTAWVSPEAELADDVEVGAHATIEGPVKVGSGTVLRPHARLLGPLTMGKGNLLFGGATLGDWPQDRKYKGEYSETIIGDDNIFRENVTIHRGTGLNTKTVVGDRNFFMVNSHVGHNCRVGNDVMMINNSLLGGHCVVEDRAIIGANCGIHQFCRIGFLAMLSHAIVLTVDLPPYCVSLTTNHITQLNGVGLRRCGMSKEAHLAVRQMFKHVFRTESMRMLKPALGTLPAELTAYPEVQRFVDFCMASKRGLARFQKWSHRSARAESGEPPVD